MRCFNIEQRHFLSTIDTSFEGIMSDREFGGNDDLSLPKGINPPSLLSLLFSYTVPNSPTATLTATVQKIISEILLSSPAGSSVSFARDARDLLIECCVEFITLISSEANEIAEKEQKKTIAIEHIDKALRDLGFPEYVREVVHSAGDAKEMLKVSRAYFGYELREGSLFWERGVGRMAVEGG